MTRTIRTVLWGLFLTASGPCTSFAQTTSTLSGKVSDAVTSAPLVGAAVQVFLADTSYGATTDGRGNYRLTDVPTGIHRVRASFVGYRPTEVAEVWVRSGREEHVVLELHRAVSELSEVEVRASAPDRMDAIGAHTLTVEKSLRYPATFFDPARLAMSYAGVASVNDQANHFSVRGTNPSYNAWLLEGVEIVTPNHLTNAGTANDLPTLTGGGTTILSAQMLGTSRLLTGSLAANYGNALGGIMDLRLRPGSSARRGFTAQAGLIGIDLSAEGPFKAGGKATYLVNYRYSTLGLLGAMGVALGDEAISFQDLSFHVHLPMTERGSLSVFGMGGTSSNRFDAKDSTEWEFDKDSQDIDYEAQVAVVGLTFQQRLGPRTRWNTSVAWSRNEQERNMHQAAYRNRSAMQDVNGLAETKMSAYTHVIIPIGLRGRLDVGMHAMERVVDKRYSWLVERNDSWLIRPYIRYRHQWSERVDMDLGGGYTHWTACDAGAFEPRLALGARIGGRGRLDITAGIRSQMPLVQNYVLSYSAPGLQFDVLTDNSDLRLLRAYDVELRYVHQIQPHLSAHLAIFGQEQTDVPRIVPAYFSTTWPTASMVNAWNEMTVLQLAQDGDARVIGGEFSIERTLFRGLFYSVNTTYFNSTYTNTEGARYPARWNTRYTGNLVVGREFSKQKEEISRTWGVTARFNVTGGQPGVSATVGGYYEGAQRLDLRVYLKRERTGRTGMWSLDLLNATNAKNVAYRYYDQRKQAFVTKYQLGLIPNLSYRIEF